METIDNELPNYINIIKKGTLENIAELKKEIIDIEEKDIVENKNNKNIIKITNWADRYGYESSQILKKIKEDNIFACNFIKAPSKQNLFEKAAAEYIKKLNIVKNFKKLPSGGKDCIHIEKGVFKRGKIISPFTKSIDFKWETEKYIYYAMHKYTKDEGGAQANQHNDIQNYLESCREFEEKELKEDSFLSEDKSLKKEIYFLAICDGEYYLKIENKTKTRIENLNVLCIRNSKAITIEKLNDFLKQNENKLL